MRLQSRSKRAKGGGAATESMGEPKRILHRSGCECSVYIIYQRSALYSWRGNTAAYSQPATSL